MQASPSVRTWVKPEAKPENDNCSRQELEMELQSLSDADQWQLGLSLELADMSAA